MNAAQQVKPVSAAKKRESGPSRMKNKRGGEHIRWKRIVRAATDTHAAAALALKDCPPAKFDELVAVIAGNQKLTTAVTRWVYFKHLTPTQGIAARHYANIMRKFDRYHVGAQSRAARAQGYQPGTASQDQELERRAMDGTLDQYEADARKAKRQYLKLHKVIAPYPGAKEMLDCLCILEIEPPANHRASCAAVLSLIAKAFDLEEARK